MNYRDGFRHEVLSLPDLKMYDLLAVVLTPKDVHTGTLAAAIEIDWTYDSNLAWIRLC